MDLGIGGVIILVSVAALVLLGVEDLWLAHRRKRKRDKGSGG